MSTWICAVCNATSDMRPAMCPECFNASSYRPVTRVETYRADVQVRTLSALYADRTRPAKFPERWRAFLGAVPLDHGWLALWYGPPGSMKSTALLLLLAEAVGHGVFVSVEEGLGDSLREKIQRLELVTDAVVVTTSVDVGQVVELARERGTTWIAWDSLTVSSLLPEDLEGLRRDGFHVVLACHSTKAGEYHGAAGLAHIVDHVARFVAGNAVVAKNRYGVAGVEFPVIQAADIIICPPGGVYGIARPDGL